VVFKRGRCVGPAAIDRSDWAVRFPYVG